MSHHPCHIVWTIPGGCSLGHSFPFGQDGFVEPSVNVHSWDLRSFMANLCRSLSARGALVLTPTPWMHLGVFDGGVVDELNSPSSSCHPSLRELFCRAHIGKENHQGLWERRNSGCWHIHIKQWLLSHSHKTSSKISLYKHFRQECTPDALLEEGRSILHLILAKRLRNNSNSWRILCSSLHWFKFG